MKRWVARTAKASLILGIAAGIYFGANWARHNTPPAGFNEFLAALNADDATFGQYLQDNKFTAADGVGMLYRLRADGTNWQFVRVRKWEGGQPSVVVKSSEGKSAQITLWSPSGRPMSALVWRYINGKTLQEMADSAQEVTRAPGVSIGIWRNGKAECASSGFEDLASKKAYTEASRVPVWSERALIQLATARLKQDGKYRGPEVGGALTSKLAIAAIRDSMGGPVNSVIEREVLRPLKLPDAAFGSALATTYTFDLPSKTWYSQGFRFGPEVKTPLFLPIESSPRGKNWPPEKFFDGELGLSVRDYLALGRYRLESLRGKSDYLGPKNLANLSSESYGYVYQMGWGRNPEGSGWGLNTMGEDFTVAAWALPEEDAVIVFTANAGLDSSEFVGGIMWRVYELLVKPKD